MVGNDLDQKHMIVVQTFPWFKNFQTKEKFQPQHMFVIVV